MEKDYKEKYKAQNKYQEKNYNIQVVRLYVRKDDTAILKKLKSVPSKSGYVIDLIRKDIGEDNK